MTPQLDKIYLGDNLATMKTWPDACVQTCITSPPYFGLRDYGVAGQIGREPTPEAFIARLVEVFREVHRVLRDDGTLWLNLGDCYNTYDGNRGVASGISKSSSNNMSVMPKGTGLRIKGLKYKDLVGVPWMAAFALRADGWYLRSEIIWAKKNCMPESVTDRPTKAHEQIFLLSKAQDYFYDHEAIKEKATLDGMARRERADHRQKEGWAEAYGGNPPKGLSRKRGDFKDKDKTPDGRESFKAYTETRNKRTVWEVALKPFNEAHFATFPPELITPCVLAGAPRGGVVLDPFMGAGTTALVAATHDRRFLGCELNPEYVKIADKRIAGEVAQEKLL